MLTPLRPLRVTPLPGSPAARLLEFHARIWSYADLAVRLAEPEGQPDGELTEAATRLHRFFTVAWPLHCADEEVSIEPRLVALLARESPDVLGKVAREHAELERRLEWLRPRWRV